MEMRSPGWDIVMCLPKSSEQTPGQDTVRWHLKATERTQKKPSLPHLDCGLLGSRLTRKHIMLFSLWCFDTAVPSKQ